MNFFIRFFTHLFISLSLVVIFFISIDLFKEYITNPDMHSLLISFSETFREINKELFKSVDKDSKIFFEVGFLVSIIFLSMIFLLLENKIFKVSKVNEEKYQTLEKHFSKIETENFEKDIAIDSLKDLNKDLKQKQKNLDKYQNFYYMIHNNYDGNFLDFFTEVGTKILDKEIGDIQNNDDDLNELNLDFDMADISSCENEMPNIGNIENLDVSEENYNDIDPK